MEDSTFDDQKSNKVTDQETPSHDDQDATLGDLRKTSNDMEVRKSHQDKGKEEANDHEISQDSKESNNPEGKACDKTVGNKQDQSQVDQSSQKEASEIDHEVTNDQTEAASNQTGNQGIPSTSSDNAKSDIKADQDEVKSPSTPPHMISKSTCADSQATEKIDSDNHDSQTSGSEGDDEHQSPNQSSIDKDHNQQHPSDDEEEKKMDRPWYNFFWGSSDPPGKKKVKIPRKPSVWSARDTVAYRAGYPGKKDNKKINQNLKFYQNMISSYPHGNFIDIIHEDWWGDYQLLENNHSYIQWLFPIREQGLNMHAEVLQLHEAEAICSDPVAHGRVLKSYKMMLAFYGMSLKDEKTGEVERADNWKERFRHLNHSMHMHNYLRITRILKCLGEMKLEHLKAPFVRYVLHEIITEQTLYNCLDSCINYWLQVIRNDQEREDLLEYAEVLARDTQSTPIKSKSEDETSKKAAAETKKETQSAKKQQNKKAQAQPKKEHGQSTKKQTLSGGKKLKK